MTRFLARLTQALQKNKTAPTDASLSAALPGAGTVIDGRYRLEAEIGRGGMGIVYRAHDIPNGREVAVKVINLSEANALTREQFLREVEIVTRLDHSQIVKVFETGLVAVGAAEPSPFIVMELVQGTRLDEMRGFTYSRIIDIGRQICDALKYIHDQGLVYRDLKPGNVILEKRGFHYSVKLLDFGLARPRGETYRPRESNLAGSVFYLAPELIAGQPADVGSDLYALGATLYEMLTGRVPFSNIDEQNILSQHLDATVPPPSQSRTDVPGALESVILRLLEKNPRNRFASAGDVCHALDGVVLERQPAAHGNLPSTIPAGQENEIAQVVSLLEAHRLVTMLDEDETLALATGAQLADQFADGVWLANLGSAAEPAMALPIVMGVFDVCESPDRPPVVSLLENLREKNLLLLLLGCDRVRGACAQLAETILRACPDLCILAVSHQPLNISGEKCYRRGP